MTQSTSLHMVEERRGGAVHIDTPDPGLAWLVGRVLIRRGYRVTVSAGTAERRPSARPVRPSRAPGTKRTPPLLRALVEAARTQQEGEVVCRSGLQVGRVSFLNGAVVAIEVLPGQISWRERLTRELGLDAAIVADVARECDQVEGNLYEWLVELGHVERERLQEWLFASFSAELRNMLAWQGAQAMFVPGSIGTSTNDLAGHSLVDLLDGLRDSKSAGSEQHVR